MKAYQATSPYGNSSDVSRRYFLKKIELIDYLIHVLFIEGRYRIGRMFGVDLVIIT